MKKTYQTELLIYNIGLMACHLKHSSAVLHLHSVNSVRMTRPTNENPYASTGKHSQSARILITFFLRFVQYLEKGENSK